MSIIMIAVAVIFTALSFAIPASVYHGPMLHAITVVAWLIATILLVMTTVSEYPGTIIPTAVGLFGTAMVIIHTTMIVIPLMKERSRDTYDDEQLAIKKRIANITKQNNGKKSWWE